MPLDVPSRSYVLPDTQRADDVVRDLAERLRAGKSALDVETAEPVETTFTLLDTADRRLRAAGLNLAAETAGSGVVLRLDEADNRPVRAELPRALRRYIIGDLPPGPLRERLAPVIDVRALLPLVDVHRRGVPAAILNDDAKTVVRLTVSDLWASPAADGGQRERARFGLSGRVELAGVLGYRRPFARVEAVFDEDLALAEPTTSLIDEAVRAVGDDPAGLSNKVKVPLDADEPAGGAARRILVRLADVVEANLPGTFGDLDPEFLHDLRVAVRRSRSVLRELKAAFDDDARREHADTLRWIQAITGPTRDLDVQLLEWDDLVARLPEDRRRFLDPAHAVLRARRAAALRSLRRTLRSAQYHRRWDAWRTFLDADRKRNAGPQSDRPVHELAGRRVHKVYERMVADGAAITEDSPAQALHDLRKKGKELRYLLESFGPLWPRSTTRPLVADLKALQDVLGRHQDCEVQAGTLRSLAEELVAKPGGPDAVLALGSLVDRLEGDERDARAEFAGRFKAFSKLKLDGIT